MDFGKFLDRRHMQAEDDDGSKYTFTPVDPADVPRESDESQVQAISVVNGIKTVAGSLFFMVGAGMVIAACSIVWGLPAGLGSAGAILALTGKGLLNSRG